MAHRDDRPSEVGADRNNRTYWIRASASITRRVPAVFGPRGETRQDIHACGPLDPGDSQACPESAAEDARGQWLN